MVLNTDVMKNIITKDIFDSYGRKLGKVVAFLTDSTKNVSSIGVELNNGDFSYYSPSQISIQDNTVVAYYPWQVESERLNDEYVSALRKNSALHKLNDSGEIPQEVYDELRKQYEFTIKSLTERCQILSEDLKEKIKMLDVQVKELKTFLTNIRIEYMVQNIDEKSYTVSCLTLQNMLTRVLLEKKDMDAVLKNIPKNSSFSEIIQDLPPVTNSSQPILLRIKEAET